MKRALLRPRARYIYGYSGIEDALCGVAARCTIEKTESDRGKLKRLLQWVQKPLRLIR